MPGEEARGVEFVLHNEAEWVALLPDDASSLVDLTWCAPAQRDVLGAAFQLVPPAE